MYCLLILLRFYILAEFVLEKEMLVARASDPKLFDIDRWICFLESLLYFYDNNSLIRLTRRRLTFLGVVRPKRRRVRYRAATSIEPNAAII